MKGSGHIIYIGNMMSRHGGSVGVIETLTPIFKEKFIVYSASDKKNQWLRLIDMLYTVWKNRKGAGLVIIDTYSSKAFWYSYLVALLAKRLRIPYIPFLHGGNFPNRLPEMSPKKLRIFSDAAINISPSIYLKEAFEKYGFKVVYMPNAVHLEQYHFKKRSVLSPHLLWVRAFEKIYNPVMAIEVLNLVKKQFPEATLCMVGKDKDGTMISAKQRAEALGLSDAVTFTGYMPKAEWLKLSESFDIFFNTTNIDNHPVSVVEAMALGLPVVSTNAGGIPYFITSGENGLLSPVGDTQQMAELIIQLLHAPDLSAKLSEQGRKSVSELDLGVMKQKWWDLLEEYRK